MNPIADNTRYLNISAYKFVSLQHLPVLQADLHAFLDHQGVKGTVLLADEGINIALAGEPDRIEPCVQWFARDARFQDLFFKRSHSSLLPFSKLKVKIRHEIIGFGQQGFDPEHNPAPTISPTELKRWLDEGREFTLLDTRNDYEIESGTFTSAESLDIGNFKEFAEQLAQRLPRNNSKPIVTFCTGGVRCEKAAPWMLANGYNNVLQIEGGILNYFEQCGDAHWQGDCFVFDDRVEVDSALHETGSVLCKRCHRAVSIEQQQAAEFIDAIQCPACADKPV